MVNYKILEKKNMPGISQSLKPVIFEITLYREGG